MTAIATVSTIATADTCARHRAPCFSAAPSMWCRRVTVCELCGRGSEWTALLVTEDGIFHDECLQVSEDELALTVAEHGDPYTDDEAYARFCREQQAEYDALMEGSAVEVHGCHECAGEPFRAVKRHVAVNPADPTAAYVLACGHTTIDL